MITVVISVAECVENEKHTSLPIDALQNGVHKQPQQQQRQPQQKGAMRPAALVTLATLNVNGHEIDADNNFQLCIAMSMLVRTLLHLIQRVDGVSADIEIPHEGSTIIRDIVIAPHLKQWFAGVSALFLQGMRDLAAQFPKQLTLAIDYASNA